jgi:hypothetical protein
MYCCLFLLQLNLIKLFLICILLELNLILLLCNLLKNHIFLFWNLFLFLNEDFECYLMKILFLRLFQMIVIFKNNLYVLFFVCESFIISVVKNVKKNHLMVLIWNLNSYFISFINKKIIIWWDYVILFLLI